MLWDLIHPDRVYRQLERTRSRQATRPNIPGKPRIFMPCVGGVGAYRKKCDDVAAKELRGLHTDRVNALTPGLPRQVRTESRLGRVLTFAGR